MSGGPGQALKQAFQDKLLLAAVTVWLVCLAAAGCALPVTYSVPTRAYPTYFTSTPQPTVTPLPSPTITPTPLVAAGIDTPVAPSSQVISAENSARLARFAQWGRGIARQAAWSSDGRLIVVAATHGIYAFDAQTLVTRGALENGYAWHSVAFSPDGRLLAAGGENGEITLWDAQVPATELFTRKPLNIFSDHRLPVYNLFFSPDSNLLASCGWDNRVLLWQVSSDKIYTNDLPLLTLDDFSQPVQNLAFSSDNKLLYTWLAKGSVQTWSLSNGKHGRDFYLPQHYSLYSSSAAIDSTASVITVNYGTTLRTMRLRDGITMNVVSSLPAPAQEVFLTPGGELLVTLDSESIRIWQAGQGTRLGEATPEQPGGNLIHGALSPDGQTLLTLGDALRLWSISSHPVLLKTMQAGFITDYPVALGFSEDSRSLVAGLLDGSLLTYHLADGALMPPVSIGGPPLSSMALAERRTLFAVGQGDKQINLVQSDGKAILNLNKEKSLATNLALSPDGSLFGASTADNTVLVRRSSDGSTLQTLKKIEGISLMSFSPDSSLLALRAKNGISLWQVDKAAQLSVMPGYAFSFSPDGRLLAISLTEDGKSLTRVRQLADGTTLSVIQSAGSDLAFSPDGQILAISGPSLTLWRVADGALLQAPAAMNDELSPFSRLAFSPDGRMLAQLSPDGVLSLWGVP